MGAAWVVCVVARVRMVVRRRRAVCSGGIDLVESLMVEEAMWVGQTDLRQGLCLS